LTQAYPLFRELATAAAAQHTRWLYVIVGPTSFSAGITHAAQLKQSGPAQLAGTEPGDELDFWAEGGNVRLPHSGIDMHFADRLHSYSAEPIPPHVSESLVYLDLAVSNLTPGLPAQWLWSSYRLGRDPFTEVVTNLPLSDCALVAK
jgi:hypothetical protein